MGVANSLQHDIRVQLLRKQLVELQAHFSSLEQQISDKLQTLQTIIPAASVTIARHQTNQQELSGNRFKIFFPNINVDITLLHFHELRSAG